MKGGGGKHVGEAPKGERGRTHWKKVVKNERRETHNKNSSKKD